jgi:hypothetical protein
MASLGFPAQGKARWCTGCAKAHTGAVNVVNKKCEDCQLKLPSFGLPSEGTSVRDRKVRWCSGCSKGHVGAENLVSKRCEGCGKQASFGLPADGKVRWCVGCAKAHVGAVGLRGASRRCEGCNLKQPTFGLPAEGKVRWCSGCAEAHLGAVVLTRPKRKGRQGAVSVSRTGEACDKPSVVGFRAEGKRRWCAGCAKAHAGAVDLSKKRCEDCGLKEPSLGLASGGKQAERDRGFRGLTRTPLASSYAPPYRLHGVV